MKYYFTTFPIPFVGEVNFYFVEKMTGVPFPPHLYVQGRIFLPEFDETHYLTLPSLEEARKLVEEVVVWINDVNRVQSSIRLLKKGLVK